MATSSCSPTSSTAVQLDTTKWWTRYVYGSGKLDRLNDEKQRYRERGTT